MVTKPRVLVISSDEADTDILKGILSERVALHCVRDLSELHSNLLGGGYDAVFCGWSFYRATWNDVLEHVQRHNPNLPVIVFCRTGGEREWVEVLEAGAFDLLVAPYRKASVFTVLEQAVASYEGRHLHMTLP